MSELIAQLNWRYATKKFNPTKIVAHDAVERILEAIRLTATSSDLQPFEVFVITNLGIREKIKAIGWNQEQITDCSHLLVFAAWDDITADRVNLVFDLTNEVRGETSEAWENYRHQLLGMVAQRSQEENYQSAARQAYIALGTALIAAAFERVDSTPMEGFDPVALDEILGLKTRNLRSVVILPLGYRADEGDWLVDLKKVRRAREDFVTEIQ